MVMDVQKLMSVLKEHMGVLTLVQTLLGAIRAPVIQDIAWQVIDGHVMVITSCTQSPVSSNEKLIVAINFIQILMNALKIVMDVHTHAIMLLAATPALVVLAIA